MEGFRISIKAVLFIFTFAIVSSLTYARSLYVITKYGNCQLSAYRIQDSEIDHQTDTLINPGAIGLALDPDSGTLFVTYDGSDVILLVNARTMERITYIPKSDELCGIAYDRNRQKVYATSREDKKLYVYLWDSDSKTLTADKIITLNEIPYGYYTYGITMDDLTDVLYVADRTNTVKMYDADDPNFGYLGSIDIAVDGNDREAVGIDFYRDPQGNQYLYTGAWMHDTQHEYLVRTDITDVNNPVSTERYLGSGVGAVGIAVDQATGYVYITTSNNHIEVYSPSGWPADPCDVITDNISGPAGLCVRADVSYKAPAFSLVKDNNDPNNGCVEPFVFDNYLVYDIYWDANGFADTNVFITDKLPSAVEYYTSDPCGAYDPNTHTVVWGPNDITGSDSGHITLTLKVTIDAVPGGTLTNVCTMEGDGYKAPTPASVTTDICCWRPGVLYVDADANDGGDGFGWDTAFNDLQTALGLVAGGECYDTIYVAAGTYKPTQDANLTGANFALRDNSALFGHFGGIGTYETDTLQRNLADANNETILDGRIGGPSQMVFRVVEVVNDSNVVIDGFTIKRSYNAGNGAGVYIDDSNVVIENCKFIDNKEYGVYAIGSSFADIFNCTFLQNRSAGLYADSAAFSARITDCIFDGNDISDCGLELGSASGIDIQGCIFRNHYSSDEDTGVTVSNANVTITDCNFFQNYLAAYFYTDVNLTISGSSFKSNHFALQCEDSDIEITLSTFSDNYDGLYLYSPYSTSITNCGIYGNNVSGIYLSGPSATAIVRNNTICKNGIGIDFGSGTDPNITNCILWGNDTELSGCSASYSCIEGGDTNNNNINSDPCFYDYFNDEYHLTGDSPCIDTGTGTYPGETDVDGEDRVMDGDADGNDVVDMGADEYYWPKADYDENWIVNFFDYSKLANNWLDVNENISLNTDSDVDIDDLALFCEDWLWQAPWGNGFLFLRMGGDGYGGGMLMSEGGLMLSGISESMNEMPDSLYAKVEKFYTVTPAAQPVYSSPQQKAEFVEDALEWLDDLWESGQIKDCMTYQEYLEFCEAIKLSAEQDF
jgi:parallel beta-helix repeat protein